MIVTEQHPNSGNIVVFDCSTKKTVGYIKSFDTDTKKAIMYITENIPTDKGNIVRVKTDKDLKTVVIEIYLPDCILIDCKTKEIIK